MPKATQDQAEQLLRMQVHGDVRGIEALRRQVGEATMQDLTRIADAEHSRRRRS